MRGFGTLPSLLPLQLVESGQHVDHGTMEHGMMTGMLYAGILFSAVPLIIAVAFFVFLYRQLRLASTE